MPVQREPSERSRSLKEPLAVPSEEAAESPQADSVPRQTDLSVRSCQTMSHGAAPGAPTR